ncbi:MAG TPA: DNA repair protein RadA, partial [Saprospiraceae bacterium]|nr:DNA repair protein RadA [Saprospiraceae bacterium]
MAKIKTVFTCTNCGATSAKWIGKCNSCGEWNTFIEEKVVKNTVQEEKHSSWQDSSITGESIDPIPLSDIQESQIMRTSTKDGEFNRVLGGGLVPGSVILLGGAPGIGKSTLLLQLTLNLSGKVLYVSGEESQEQIKLRAARLGPQHENCYIYTETNSHKILKQAKRLIPSLLVIDSIQTISSPHLESMPGSVSQIRECASELQRFAKESNIPVVIIGHITKEGTIAGPKLLEHIVDVVLQFDGDRNYSYRILRTIKNRFGSTDEMGIYEMQTAGL